MNNAREIAAAKVVSRFLHVRKMMRLYRQTLCKYWSSIPDANTSLSSVVIIYIVKLASLPLRLVYCVMKTFGGTADIILAGLFV